MDKVIWKTYPAIMVGAIVGLFMPCLAPAQNTTDIGITSLGQHDTVYASKASSFDVYIGNDILMGGASMGHQFWSPDGAVWSWTDVGGLGSITGCCLMNIYSRWDTGNSCFDIQAPNIWEYDVDGHGRDTILWGALAMMTGCSTGPLELIYSYHFVGETSGPEDVNSICMDSCFVPPAGAFVFVDITWNTFPPTILWPSGGRCWPVKKLVVCGDVNGDDLYNVGDPVYLIAFIFKGGPEPPNYYLADANGDGKVDVGDVVYMIANIFKSGPGPICP